MLNRIIKLEKFSNLTEKLMNINRVVKVTKGKKKLSFQACILIGDKVGCVGLGIGKGLDVPSAIKKAIASATNSIVTLSSEFFNTLPFELNIKFCASKILFKPKSRGTGLSAGRAVRSVLELAGIEDASSKVFGSRHLINNMKATMIALKEYNKYFISKHSFIL